MYVMYHSCGVGHMSCPYSPARVDNFVDLSRGLCRYRICCRQHVDLTYMGDGLGRFEIV